MTVLEIILLVVGVIIFIVSFVFSAKMDESDAERKAELTDIQKEAIERQIRDVFDDQVSEVKERTEIALDKISNVKMNEMNEYSETILSEINRNHNEVMFLYDMLNEKKKEVNNTVRDVIAVKKEINETIRNSQLDIEDASDVGFMAGEQIIQEEKTTKAKKTRTAKSKKDKDSSQAEVNAADNAATEGETKPTKRKRKTTTKSTEKTDDAAIENSAKNNEADIKTASAANNNERILKLNAEGKTVVEIAKELGLGIGEVKLVIDLFRGGK